MFYSRPKTIGIRINPATSMLLALGCLGLTECGFENSAGEVKADPTDSITLPAHELIVYKYHQGIPPPEDTLSKVLYADEAALGRHLFFDSVLSRGEGQACADCHRPENAFSDSRRVSAGVHGDSGQMNAPSLFNLAWQTRFFWDGRVNNLEAQALEPVENPLEMDLPWAEAEAQLMRSGRYRSAFARVYGDGPITRERVIHALAAFERTLVSFDSRFDRWRRGEDSLNLREQEGMSLFYSVKTGCFLCHGGDLFSDFGFHNNGLDTQVDGTGLGAFTGNHEDDGKFKTPSLRNLAFSAPYMHDGRFDVVDEVMQHYSSGGKLSRTVDGRIMGRTEYPLSGDEAQKVVEFLKSLNDSTFLRNPAFQAP